MKNTKNILLSTVVVSVLSLSSFASVSADDLDCTTLDRETMKTIMDKQRAGDTLSSSEQDILDNAEACRGDNEMGGQRGGNMQGGKQMGEKEELTDEQIAEREEMKEILAKQKNGETLSSAEQTKLDGYTAKMGGKEGVQEKVEKAQTVKKKRVVKNLSTSMKTKIGAAVVKVGNAYAHLSDTNKVTKYQALQTKLEAALTKIQSSTTYSDTKKEAYQDIINELLNQLDDKIDELD